MEHLIKSITTVYKKADNYAELNSALLIQDLQRWSLQYPDHNFLHPCVINGQIALVCQANLSDHAFLAYQALAKICLKHQVFLKQDVRVADIKQTDNRRTTNAFVLSFFLGLMSGPLSARSLTNESHSEHRHATTNLVTPVNQLSVQLKQQHGHKVIRLRHAKPPSAEQVMQAYQQKKRLLTVDANAVYKIKKFLKNAYQPQVGDPVNIRADLQEMAKYYATFPQVNDLIDQLSKKNVQLKYKKLHWQAQAQGTQYSVEQVTVFFDTRVGAQLWLHQQCDNNPACHISPADTLLHELLHAKLMIVDSDTFIKNGGMKPTLYLFDHEKEVIEQENALYRVMTQTDGLARPLRARHSGDLLHVSCVLCLPE